jgi:uncharacterized protein YndB with AHSA1/START domain
MKIIKTILGFIAVIILLILIIALIAPKNYRVEREIAVNAPKAKVFDYVKYLKNQDNYSVWAKMDENMKKEFHGVDGEPGFISAWESDDKDVGKGEQEIMKIVEGKRIDFELRFMEPFKATDLAYIITTELYPGHTQVKWGFNGKMSYPMNLMLLVWDMDQMLGEDLEEGLENLKVILEQ